MAHPMNIRRGLFRLWVITAAIWVGVIVVFWLIDAEWEKIWIALAVGIGPPIAALAMGKAAFWVASGFKEPPDSK